MSAWPRKQVLRAIVTVALCVVLAMALLPAEPVAAIVGGYYPVRISPDVPGSFAAPVGLALAPSGDVYVADTSNSRVKRMSSAGVVVSVWGSRGLGAGQLREPEGIAVLPSSGRVVVADTDNNRLQLFEADGTYVSTWGSGGSGAGQFSAPCGLAVDAADNVYVADAGNGRIQKFSSAGAYLGVIGAPGVGNGQLANPRGVAVDSSGYVYVADTNNRRIQKFSSAGAYVTQWGLKEVSGTTYSRYSTPYSLAIDSTGNLLVVDAAGMKYVPENLASARYFVERCSLTGVILSQWGTPGTAPGQFAGAWGVTQRPGGGAYVTDAGNNRVQVLSATGTADAVWSGKGSANGELDSPQGLDVDGSGNAYIADTGNDRIQVFDSSGAFVRTWGTTGAGAGSLDDPTDVAIDGSGNVWVVERANNRVQSFTSTGTPISVVGAGQLSSPEGIALDGSSNVYVADTGGARVRKFSSAGVLLMTVTGSGANTLYKPSDVALDSSGNLYVSDRQYGRVRVFNSSGTYVRTIGSPGGNPGEFSQPGGVAVTGSTVFVVDSGNARIQRFTTAGVYETTFGSFGGALGDLAWPSRAVVDAAGRVVVAERDNHRLQVWAYDGVAPVTTLPTTLPDGFANFGTYSTPVTMTLSATDAASGVATTYYRLDSGTDTVYTGPVPITSDGTHVVRYWSVDRMGNIEATRMRTVTIDTTGPQGTFVLAGGASYVGTTTVASALSFTDAVDMRFDTGAGYGGWESYAPTRNLVLSGEGTRTVSVQLRDWLSNMTTYADSVTVDLTAPVTAVSGIPAGWSSAPVTVTLTATDALSGVAYRYYRLGASDTETYTAPFQIATEGETTLSFWSIDAVGNAEETSSTVVRIDTTPPSGTMQLAGGASYVATTTVSIEATVPDALEMRVDIGAGYCDWEAYAQTRDAVLSGEGTHTVTVEYRDRADNRLELEDSVYVDRTPPSTNALGLPGGWSDAPVTVVLSATDAGSGVESISYRLGSGEATDYVAPFDIDAQGANELAYWSTDSLGWVETENTATVSIDLTDPSTTATVSPAGWYSGPVTVTLTATDAVSAVADTYYRIGTGDPVSYEDPFAVGLEGSTTVSYWSVDLAGNIEVAGSVVTRVDTIAPSGTMAVAGGEAMIATTTPLVGSNVPDALEMRIDTGGGYGDWALYAPSVRVTLAGEGEHTVWVEYRDRADNRLVLSDSVYLDLTAPVTTVSGIPAGWSSVSVTVTLSAEDADSAIAATYYLIGTVLTTYGEPFGVSAEGTTTIAYWSVDELGNAETSKTATVRIDTIPPSGTMTIDGGAPFSTDSTLSIESSVTGAAEMCFDYGAGPSEWVTYAASADLTVPGEGPYTVRAVYRDLALNEFEFDRDITVDLTPPATSIDGVSATYSPVPVTLSLEATDNLSEVANTYYRIGASNAVTYTAPFEIAEEGTSNVAFWSVDGAGNVETESSAQVVLDFVPAVPGAARELASGRDWADLVWEPHAEVDVVAYSLWRRVAGVGAWASIARIDAPGTAYRDTGLVPEAAYEYRLTAHDAVGNESAPSAPVTLTAGVKDARVFGADRYATALAISRATFDSAQVAVVATGESFADALGASALAGALDAPVLITRPDSLPDGLLDELERLGVERVVIVGGVRAIGSAVETALAAGFDTQRLAGADRYATAAVVASETLSVRADTALPGGVLVVRGDNFADALAASPVAYGGRIPVLLVRPDSVPDATRDALATGGFGSAIVLGGTRAVSDEVLGDLGVSATRVFGANRYDTAAVFATWAIDQDLAGSAVAGLATGAVFPDALSGGAAIGARSGVVLLTDHATLSAPSWAWFEAHAGTLESVTIFGGERAVSAGVLEALRTVLR